MSKAANGSSNNKILGLLNRAKHITRRFFCPPDKNSALIFCKDSSSNFEINKFILSSLNLLSAITISLIAFKFSLKVRS